MTFAILIILTVILFGAIAWRDLRLGIALLLFALPSYLIRFPIGPLPTTLLEVLALVLIAIWCVKHFGLRVYGTFLNHWRVPIALMLITGTIGVIVSPDPVAALGVWKAYIIEPILIFILIRSTLKTPADVELVLLGLGASALVIAILALIQWVSGVGIPIPWDTERRVTSFYDFPNAVGLYLGPIVTIGLTHLVHPITDAKFSPTDQRWFWGLVSALGLIAIGLAKTEAALVAVPAAILLVSFLSAQARRFTLPLAVLLVVTALAVTPLRQKLLLQDYSGEVRLSQWRETVELIKERPIFGAGLSGYPIVFEKYHRDDWIEIFQYPHNLILNVWVELGLLGLIALIWIALIVIRHFLADKNDPVTIIVFTALLMMTIHGLVDVPYFKNDLAMLTWSLFAILSLAASKVERKTLP